MSRWQRPKQRKSEKDIARGQQFFFVLHEDQLMPWDIDAENEPPLQPIDNMIVGWMPPPTPDPSDPIPF